MAIDKQRPPQLGDWTVCQDKEESSTKDAIRVTQSDTLNQLNVLDWAITDFKIGGDEPIIYVPNRVYPMDVSILKPTLEGLMPIVENIDGLCSFPSGSSYQQIISAQSGYYTCDAMNCPRMRNGNYCNRYSYTFNHGGPTCKYYPGVGVVATLGVGINGLRNHIDFTINAQVAIEYLDVRITDWPRAYTSVNGATIQEFDVMGWPIGTKPPGEVFTYTAMGNNVYRIWFRPGREGINWGHAGTVRTIRVEFTLLGANIDTPYVFHPKFSGAQRTVTVSYVGAGRRGNHRS